MQKCAQTLRRTGEFAGRREVFICTPAQDILANKGIYHAKKVRIVLVLIKIVYLLFVYMALK